MSDDLVDVAWSFVWEAGEYIHGFETNIAVKTIRRRFIAHFGISPIHCASLWHHSNQRLATIDPYVKTVHLLWTLNVLKTDDTEHLLKGRWGADEKTIRKWMYIVLDVVGTLGVVRNENRDIIIDNIMVSLIDIVLCRLIGIIDYLAILVVLFTSLLTEPTFVSKSHLHSLLHGIPINTKGLEYDTRLVFALQQDGLYG